MTWRDYFALGFREESAKAKERNSQHYSAFNLFSSKVKGLFCFSSLPSKNRPIIWHLREPWTSDLLVSPQIHTVYKKKKLSCFSTAMAGIIADSKRTFLANPFKGNGGKQEPKLLWTPDLLQFICLLIHQSTHSNCWSYCYRGCPFTTILSGTHKNAILLNEMH